MKLNKQAMDELIAERKHQAAVRHEYALLQPRMLDIRGESTLKKVAKACSTDINTLSRVERGDVEYVGLELLETIIHVYTELELEKHDASRRNAQSRDESSTVPDSGPGGGIPGGPGGVACV